MLKRPENEAQLDDMLSEPYPETIEMFRRLSGDIMFLGVGGKMGPTLARMAVRAAEAAGARCRIIGVARFSEPGLRQQLEQYGVECIQCDLSDPDAVNALPECANIIFMAGRKFGSVGSESLTWIMNVIVPGNVARRFSGSRIVAFSTGCVYELLPPGSSGSCETDPPKPVGEYANSCLGRERVFEHAAEVWGTKVCLYRLNYAIDLRYGVLSDIAQPIWEGSPVTRSVQEVNVIWQGDANNRALLCLEQAASPASIMNVTGPETVSVDWIAQRFGELMGKPVNLAGAPAGMAYLNDASKSVKLWGKPRVSVDDMIAWTAHWIMQGGRNLNKPTHFAVTDGQFLDEESTAGEKS